MTEVFVHPADPSGVAFVMRRLLERAPRDWVPHDERTRQAAAALNLLGKLASDPDHYGFYDLLPQEPAVELALTVPALSIQAAQVLGWLGSPQAQRTLTTFANQAGRELSQRQAAAAALDVAVKRRGLLLTRAEILRQYDIYNASATADAGTQRVLGSILDAIENATTETKASAAAP
jgi:hypothetical protein